MNKRVLLGMSGGIDSSASALTLKEMGYDIMGVSIQFWDQHIPGFRSENIHSEVSDFCNKIKIPHIIVDARDSFKRNVLEYFYNDYINGRTPFPCARCNPLVKWRILNEKAMENQCDHIATGHYVKTIDLNKKKYILQGNDPDKDQSFFLWGLDQEILKKAVFPLGSKNKKDVKNYLLKHGFKEFKNKKESIGICFADNGNHTKIIEDYMVKKGHTPTNGYFKDFEGNILGEHSGIIHYTIGQRRGLGLDYNKAYYVLKIIPEKNEIILGNKSDLYVSDFYVTDYKVVDKHDFADEVIIKIRYRKQLNYGRVRFVNDNLASVKLNKKLDSVASGQTAVFFKNDRVIGGGFIV